MVQYVTSTGIVKAVNGVEFEIGENEVFGLIGESGCGKSTVGKTIMQLLPKNAAISHGKVIFKGRDLLSISESQKRSLRGKEIALVTQSAMNSLNPVYKVGSQLIEAMKAHDHTNRAVVLKRISELFELVGLEPSLINSYPHEFSGGMKQRSIIAMSLIHNPKLIIMDEPTTGLDVIVQHNILEKISEIIEQIQSSILLITHDISVIAQMANFVGVMYGGFLMEVGKTDEIFFNPAHPYTMGLLNAFPDISTINKELISIPGAPPSLIKDITGCPFLPRCPFSKSKCTEKIEIHQITETQRSACHCHNKSDVFRSAARKKKTWTF